jgi:hypothetical protein
LNVAVAIPTPARRPRPTLPPKAALSALRVDAAGQVVPGTSGYYWYGESIVLSTPGDEGAEYLLGGASVPHGAVVALAAILDAKRWRVERPDPVTDEWAARAWVLARHEQALTEHAARRLGEERAWQVYRLALADAVEMLGRR